MPAIGYVTRDGNGFKGELKTLSIRADIMIVPNGHKSADTQPIIGSRPAGSRSGPAGSGAARCPARTMCR
jgi:uncharacterized protein (DUF736 family)